MSSMKSYLRLLPIFATLWAGPLPAQDRQFGDILYDPPQGWDEGREKDGVKIFLSDLPGDRCEFCYVFLSTSQPDTGTLGRFLIDNLTLFEDPEDRDDFEALGAADAIEMAGRPALMRGYRFDGRKLYILIAVDLGDRKTLLGFRGSFSDEDELREISDTFSGEIIPFFDGLTFVGGTDDQLLPVATAGEMSGVWWGWRQVVGIGLDGMTRIDIDHEILVFYPDGHVYRGTPPGGVDTIDRNSMMDAFDPDFGIYTQNGRRRIDITYADGRREELTWNRSERAWSDGTIDYREVTPVADGTPLDGGLYDFNYTGFTPGSGIEGGIASSSETTFRPDGTFTGDSFGSVSGNFDGGGFTFSDGDAQSGTYVIENGLLIMTDRRGETSAEIIFDTGDGILIGDQFLDTE
ncbi:hypothetical protein [Yoonia sp. 2307UL14-13]|uniref:hypothetical protein n=1 Tax=Yoonia sp. 2307UL14-13 TaxID=3126506 RepID=UPI0030966B8D